LQSEQRKAHLAALCTNVLFAINFSVVKFVTPSFVGAYGLNVFRVVVATTLFWLLFLINRPAHSAGIQKKHIGRFVICGITGVVLNQTLFVKGLSLSTTIHASLLILITPILITFFAAFMMRERVTTKTIVGLLSGVAGAVVLVSSRENKHVGDQILLGDILIIINAIAYAFYFVLVRKLMQDYPPLHVIRWVFSFGLLAIVPLGWSEVAAIDWQVATWKVWAALAFITIGGTFLAYLFNLFSISKLGPGVTGAYIYTQPVFAAIIGISLLNEEFSLYKLLSACLIFLGVYLVTSKKKPTATQQ
jgi:drug/metabolite transporter (DMT)-like permease